MLQDKSLPDIIVQGPPVCINEAGPTRPRNNYPCATDRAIVLEMHVLELAQASRCKQLPYQGSLVTDTYFHVFKKPAAFSARCCDTLDVVLTHR